MSANEKLYDGLIKHQIYIRRLGLSESKKILKILDDNKIKYIEQIKKIEKQKDRRTFLKVLKEIKKINKEVYLELANNVVMASNEIMADQQNFYKYAIEKSMPKRVSKAIELNTPSDNEDFSNIKFTNETDKKQGILDDDGKTIEQWFLAIAEVDNRKFEELLSISFSKDEFVANDVYDELFRANKSGIYENRSLAQRQIQSVVETSSILADAIALNALINANQALFGNEVYTAILDNHTTPLCISLNGSIFPIGEGAIPPMHFRCRSKRIPVFLKGSDIISKIESGEIKANDNYSSIRSSDWDSFDGKAYKAFDFKSWLNKQNKSFIVELMGEKRAELFTSGKLPLEKMIDYNSGKFMSLKKIKEKNKKIFAF